MSKAAFPLIPCVAAISVLIVTSSLRADEPQIKPGDKVVTLTDAPLQVGSETLASIPAGIELVAETVQGDWVWLIAPEADGGRKGWIHSRSIILEPHKAFARLASGPDVEVIRPNDAFRRIDANRDAAVTANELLASSAKPTLDRLNKQLRRAMSSPAGNQYRELLRGGGACDGKLVVQHLEWGLMVQAFDGWNRAISLDEAYRLVDDFATTSDLRRSGLAQQLVDRQDWKASDQQHKSLFKWADRNRDGRLSIDEFKQVFPQSGENDGGGKND